MVRSDTFIASVINFAVPLHSWGKLRPRICPLVREHFTVGREGRGGNIAIITPHRPPFSSCLKVADLCVGCSDGDWPAQPLRCLQSWNDLASIAGWPCLHGCQAGASLPRWQGSHLRSLKEAMIFRFPCGSLIAIFFLWWVETITTPYRSLFRLSSFPTVFAQIHWTVEHPVTRWRPGWSRGV